LVVLPTDTVYGIGTRPDDASATRRLFEAKHRPRDLELPVLVPSVDVAVKLARVDDRARTLMEAFWPGPLTIVLPRAEASRRWDLGGDPDTVGVRWPRHLLARALLERTGPMAVTSANISGRGSPATCDELVTTFGEKVEVYLCQEEPLAGAASTVVDLAHGAPAVLRRGAITESDLVATLG
jgi:tRNA threonylcarbamoyl adenosine modification protein (Sua5/YciO/YrdC/YwlC family)